MTPRRPFELMEASKACAEAWLKRDAMIDAGDTIGVQMMNKVCDLLGERESALYREWQILGGTSNIETLAFPFVDYDHAEWLDENRTTQEAIY